MSVKRKFPVAIPLGFQEVQQEKMALRAKLEASCGAVVSVEKMKTNVMDSAYDSISAKECQALEGGTAKIFSGILEKRLEKDYAPRRLLAEALAETMSDLSDSDRVGLVYNPARFRVKRSVSVKYPEMEKISVVFPVPGFLPVDDFMWGDLREVGRVETVVQKDPVSMLSAQVREVDACGTWLRFGVAVDGVHLRQANFCKHRLCPFCNWRRGIKVYGALREILAFLACRSYRYIALTLTVKNPVGAQLSDTIESMLQGWRNFVHDSSIGRNFWRKWRGREPVVQGYFRSMEITINEEDDTYHPHLHVLLALDSVYYSKSESYYRDHKTWVSLWRDSMGLDYDPRVMVQAVDRAESVLYDISKSDMGVSKERVCGGGPACGSAANPVGVDDAFQRYVSKAGDEYAIKMDFLSKSDDLDLRKRRVVELFSALYRRRLVSFSGCFREARKELGLSDPETGPLDDGPGDGDLMSFVASWRYCGGYRVFRVGGD